MNYSQNYVKIPGEISKKIRLDPYLIFYTRKNVNI